MANLVIIGGGPSGMLAALSASENCHHNHQVLLIERNDRLGRKILATGNGRCNFTNLHNDETFYNEPTFAKQVLNQFNQNRVRDFFNKLGVLQINDSEGRYYPFTHNSSALLDALRFEIEARSNIKVITNAKIESIVKRNDYYILTTVNKEELKGDVVIIAGGGTSYSSLGSDGSGYLLAKKLNHSLTRLYPAITSIKVFDKDFRSLNGIRVNALVSLYHLSTHELIASEVGEVLFKEDSISGIVSFIISSFIARSLKKEPSSRFYIKLDLVTALSVTELIAFLEMKQQRQPQLSLEFFLNGIVVRMLALSILSRCMIETKERSAKDLSRKEIASMATMLKSFEVQVSGLSPFNNAQTTCGGILLTEIDPITLESKLNERLFFAGEIMDIDGECGGHNLQWAFSSGFVSGKYASEKLNERTDM